jgi:hypothetical protein
MREWVAIRVARFSLIQFTQMRIIWQMAIKWSKWPQSIPNGHKRYQNYAFKGLPKCTKTGVCVCVGGGGWKQTNWQPWWQWLEWKRNKCYCEQKEHSFAGSRNLRRIIIKNGQRLRRIKSSFTIRARILHNVCRCTAAPSVTRDRCYAF